MAGAIAVPAGIAVASARMAGPAPTVVTAIAGAVTLVAGVVLIGGGAVAVRGSHRHGPAVLGLLLGLVLVGWTALLAATWSVQPLPLRLVRGVAAVVVGYLPALFLAFVGRAAVCGWPWPTRAVDYLVVLGSRLVDGRPSPQLTERLDRAMALARRIPGGSGRRCGPNGPIVVVSGGRCRGERHAEADVMAADLLARGLPADSILREDRSRDTAENLAFSHAMLTGRDPGYRCTVLTSDVHVPRAALLAHRAGVRGRVIGARTGWARWPGAAVREFVLLLAEYRWAIAGGCALLAAAVVLPGAVVM